MNLLLSAWTVVVAVVFLGVVVWTLQRSRTAEFDEAAQIPLNDDTAEEQLRDTQQEAGSSSHG